MPGIDNALIRKAHMMLRNEFLQTVAVSGMLSVALFSTVFLMKLIG